VTEDFFVIGEIVNTQGVKGDVRAVPMTDDVKRFELLESVYIEQNGTLSTLDIERVWYHKQFVILKFGSIDDAEAAGKLKWAKIKIPPSLALPLYEDEYYERDLIGMNVVEDGERIGCLERILRTGANDVYCVKTAEGEILIPAIKQCVKSVNVGKNEMVVSLMPGMRK
jgi:16S rRNA processing protein RimM